MTKYTTDTYSGSYLDDDYDYSSSRAINEQSQRLIPFPIPGITMRKRYVITPLIKFPSDGVSERVRPATMKNSENGDFIICQTNRGSYVACRKPTVPSWVRELVHEIELLEK